MAGLSDFLNSIVPFIFNGIVQVFSLFSSNLVFFLIFVLWVFRKVVSFLNIVKG